MPSVHSIASSAATPVNADPKAPVVVDTNAMPWAPTVAAGVSCKVLERIIDPRKGRETALVKFEAGSALPAEDLETRMDVVVLDGAYQDELGSYAKYTFVREMPGVRRTLSSRGGCLLYIKRRMPIRADERGSARSVVVIERDKWVAVGQRFGMATHLYRDVHGLETARLGEMLPGKQVPAHDHAIGEESLILYGCLKDEHRDYTQGFWVRFPHGYEHAPYTLPDTPCGMLIREGDLIW